MLVHDKAPKREDVVNWVKEEEVLVVYYSFGLDRRKCGRVRDKVWCIRWEEVSIKGDVGWGNKGKSERGLRLPRH